MIRCKRCGVMWPRALAGERCPACFHRLPDAPVTNPPKKRI